MEDVVGWGGGGEGVSGAGTVYWSRRKNDSDYSDKISNLTDPTSLTIQGRGCLDTNIPYSLRLLIKPDDYKLFLSNGWLAFFSIRLNRLLPRAENIKTELESKLIE